MDVLEEILDQVLHVLWGFLPLVIFWAASKARRYGPMALLGGFCGAVAFALPRELVDQWPIDRVGDMILDTFMFGLGGLLAGLTMWRVSHRR